MNAMLDFIYKNNHSILIFIIVFLLALILFNLSGINANAVNTHKKIVQQVVLETMKNRKKNTDTSLETDDSTNNTCPCAPEVKEDVAEVVDEYGNIVQDTTTSSEIGAKGRRRSPTMLKPDPEKDMMAEREYRMLGLSPTDSFCEVNKSSGIALQAQCSMLSQSTCNTTNCCVWANGKCLAGNAGGPIFKTDRSGNPLNVDTYYYRHKCFGEKCNMQKMMMLKKKQSQQ